MDAYIKDMHFRKGAEGVSMNKKHNLDELKVVPKVRFISKPDISVQLSNQTINSK